MRKFLLFAALISSILLNAQYSGGTGTEEDPFLVSSKEDLLNLSNDQSNWNKSFLQTSNIIFTDDDFSQETFSPIGGFSVATGVNILEFTGKYNGGNHSIENIKILTSDRTTGLFGTVSGGGVIENVNLIGGTIEHTSFYSIGGLVGNLSGASIINCYSSAKVINSHASNNGSGGSIGGLVGAIDNNGTSLISKSAAEGNVTSTSAKNTGGLVGIIYNTGTINIYDCYATGDVTGTENVGGLIGRNSKNIERCYASGTVTGTTGVGRLVGVANASATSSDCFWVDLNDGGTSAQGTGKSDEEMKMQSTFTNWDFTTIWQIDEGNAYPVFKTENLSVEIINQENTKLSIYPNPVKNTLNLKTNKAIKSVELYTLEGRLIQTASTKTINVSSQKSGTYIVKVNFEDNTSKVEKLIKK